MNLKIFALGAVLGLAVAIAPSCGAASKCSVSNCKGCCSGDGKCVADPNNANNTSCGTQGNACVDCSKTNQVCNKSSYQCGVTGTGGGDGQDSGIACGGCTTPTGLCLENVSFTNCGANGSACVPCQTGQYCSNGACQTPDAGAVTGGIGAACTQDSECNGVKVEPGYTAFCKKQSEPGGLQYKGGYCTRRCTGNESCGMSAGNLCLTGGGARGELENICLKNCTGPSSCRDGYACYQFGTTASCWIVQADGGIPERFDAGNPNPSAAGAACTTNAQCGGDTNLSLGCNGATLPDGGPTGYWGGQCAGNCSISLSDSWCGDGGTCLGYITNSGTPAGPLILFFCGEKCNPKAATTTCRADYVCDPYGDPSTATNGSCTPDCRKNPALICQQAAQCNGTTGLCN